ncbi:MAG: hypothetical protein ACTSV7_00830 [Candidatus Baldrarchaeia archaeon]
MEKIKDKVFASCEVIDEDEEEGRVVLGCNSKLHPKISEKVIKSIPKEELEKEATEENLNSFLKKYFNVE